MVFEDLREFIDHLGKTGNLRTMDDEVDPELELTYILSEEERIGKGDAILFNSVKDSQIPAVGNLFSTRERMELILGGSPEDIGLRLQNLIRVPDDTDSMISRGLEMMKELGGVKPKISSSMGSSHRTMEKVDLGRYPICKTWPQDGGNFITLPLVITRDPVTGQRNMGMYRMQVFDNETTGMHWHIHKGGSEYEQNYAERSKLMDVAVVLGSDPLTMFSAVAPLPNGIDEFSFRGIISRKRMELVRGQTVDLVYPRNSEIVLEGYVDPSETRVEGPFGDHTGYYSLEAEFPVFHIKKIIEKDKPLYPTTIVGKLWHEDVIMGKAIERMFLPLVRIQIPEIVDMNTMEEAVFHNMVVVSIKKRYPGHAKKVMFAIWGMGQLMFSKIVLVVDPDINVHDRKQVIWAMSTRIDPSRDVIIIPGTVTDSLDHPASTMNYGSKMGIDATRKDESEGFMRPWPDVLDMKQEIVMEAQAKREKLRP